MPDYITSANLATVEKWGKYLNTQVVLNDHQMFDPSKGWAEVLPKGTPPSKAICYDTNLAQPNGGGGDTVTHHMQTALKGKGVAGEARLTGKELKPNLATWKYVIDLWRVGVRDVSPMNQQRLNVPWVKNHIPLLMRLATRHKFFAGLMHMAGYEGLASSSYVDDAGTQIDASDLYWTMNNSIVSTAASCYTAAGNTSYTTDEEVNTNTTSSRPTKAALDQLYLDIMSRRHPLQPFLYTESGPIFPLLMDPQSIWALEQDSNWTTISTNMLQGGFIKNNPIFSGAVHVYKQFAIFNIYRGLPLGFNSTTFAALANVRRCIVLGVGALAMAYGMHYTPKSPFDLLTDTDDLKERLWHAMTITGMTRPQFTDPNDSVAYDIGTHVWSVYAA